ncbi:MAG: hypothetical protein IPI67_18035 [Myxococcales bacterium]|nr:hypothetical protein [Myxococcales bacterium]
MLVLHRLPFGIAVLLAGCCGARASGKQYITPNGTTAYVKCRSDIELCHEHARLLCGSRDYEILSQSEELGGACSPSWGFLNTWYKMNIACRAPRARPRPPEPQEEDLD